MLSADACLRVENISIDSPGLKREITELETYRSTVPT